MNPDIRFNAKDSDPPRMKRKVIRGGSWKDVGYFLQTSTVITNTRILPNHISVSVCVIDLPPTKQALKFCYRNNFKINIYVIDLIVNKIKIAFYSLNP